MTFKQNTKMSASGSHYCAGGKVKKMAGGGGTGFVNVPQTTTQRPVAGSGARLTQAVLNDIAKAKGLSGRTATANEVQNAFKNAPRMTQAERAFSGADNVSPSRAVDMPSGSAQPVTVVSKDSAGQLKKGGKVTRGNKRK